LETDLRGLKPKIKEEVLASLNRAFEKLPGNKGAVPAIKVDYTMDLRDYALTNPADGAIALNGALYKNPAKLKKRYANDVRIKEHTKGTNYRSIVVHEAGHSIMLMISVKRGLQVEELCTNIQKDVLDCYNLSQNQIRKELSRYAKDSPFDFVAEGLTEFIDSKTPRRVAIKIGEIVLSYVRKLQ